MYFLLFLHHTSLCPSVLGSCTSVLGSCPSVLGSCLVEKGQCTYLLLFFHQTLLQGLTQLSVLEIKLGMYP
jgi:hypothetical protein